MPSNLTLVGSPTFVAAAAGYGTCLSLSGTGQRATVGGTAFHAATAGGSFTIECRVKFSSQTGWHVIASSNRQEAAAWAIGVGAVTANRPYCYVAGVNSSANMEATSLTIGDGAWHSLALVVSGTGASLYVDGTVPAGCSGTGSYAPPGSGTWVDTIGDFGTVTAPANAAFAGQIDELRVSNTNRYTAAYTPATVPFSNTTANTVGLWHLDSGNVSGTLVLDCAGATFAVAPTSGGTGQALTFTGTATQWDLVPPSYTITGASNAIGSQAVTTATAATGNLTGPTTGAQTITDQSSGATAAFTVTAPTAVLSLTGPTYGNTGTASGTMTVTTSIAPGSNQAITLTDGAGGTFTPASPTILSGQTSATFTYTPASAGLKTITASAAGSTAGTKSYRAYSGQQRTEVALAPYGATYTAQAAALGVTVYDTAGATLLPRTTGLVAELAATGTYIAPVPVEPDWTGAILWDALGGLAPWVQALTAAPPTAADIAALFGIAGSVTGTPAAGTFVGAAGLSAVDDFYNGAVLVFTSGVLDGIARKITDYTGATRTFTFGTAFPAAPTAGNTFLILGRIE